MVHLPHPHLLVNLHLVQFLHPSPHPLRYRRLLVYLKVPVSHLLLPNRHRAVPRNHYLPLRVVVLARAPLPVPLRVLVFHPVVRNLPLLALPLRRVRVLLFLPLHRRLNPKVHQGLCHLAQVVRHLNLLLHRFHLAPVPLQVQGLKHSPLIIGQFFLALHPHLSVLRYRPVHLLVLASQPVVVLLRQVRIHHH